MAKISPWSVKGVDPEAREAAKIAARRQGVPVGRWLTQTILSAAARELKTGGAVPLPFADPSEPMRGPGHEQHGGNYAQQSQQPGGGPPALTPEAVLESIQKLATRIEESEQRTTEVIRPIADKVGELGAQIDEIKQTTGASTAPVERAMMRLSERLDRIEDGAPKARASRTSGSEGGLLSRLFGRD